MKSRKTNRHVFTDQDFLSDDGFLTTVWGPPMWHFLHTMSFNYPVHPTAADKRNYGAFITGLQHILPCKYCRDNLKTNFRNHPLRACHLANRDAFSRYVYDLHEIVNKLLGKSSGLSYCDVRERYEHFRARCTDNPKPRMLQKTRKHKQHKGCTEPLYGKHSKCVLKIIPQDARAESLSIDRQCIKQR
jgi:hypothetical protein